MTNYYKIYKNINSIIIYLYNKIYKKPYKNRNSKWATDGLPESQPPKISSRL